MDILCYNIEYWFNGLDLEAAMDYWKINFVSRENNWIGYDKE